MNALDGILDDLNTADFAFIEKGLQEIEDVNKNITSYFERVNDFIKEYQTTGVIPQIASIENWEVVPEDSESPQNTNKRASIKENIEPLKLSKPIKQEASPPRTRPKRNAFKEASQNIAQQSNLSTGAKLRRPTNLQDNFQNVYVKAEKLSICNNEASASDGPDRTDAPLEVTVKKEIEAMPAPTRPAPRRKKQKESKLYVKEEKIEEEQQSDSDVIIQDATVTTINLAESSDEGEVTLKSETTKEEKSRSTRTKTVKKKMKRTRTHSSEDEGKTEKRSRSNEEKEVQKEETLVNETHFEDAVSTMEENKGDATFVAKPANGKQESPQDIMNATVIVENPKLVTNLMPKTVEDMMTDDESEEEVPKKPVKPVKPVRAIPKPTKQVFSPFEHSPVKQKVQAFEKLKEDANTLPPRMTRTKTKAKAKQQEETSTDPEPDPTSNVKEKAKIFTPQASKFLPKAASTTVKPGRSAPSSSNESLSSKSVSALKASQAEYREREKRRREKEQEALKKRDALLQAQIEEKKRKREEKQLKAQQQREVLEKEKLKMLEQQRLKDERHKQLLAEQEEKKLKQREEIEKKRLMAKMRALEEKKREGERSKEEEKKVEDQRPLYMRYRAPLLPTDDCYDSDDEHYRPERVKVPDFAKEANIRFMQRCTFAAGEAVKNSFFSIQAQTPDLQDIFEVIKPEKLKRTSSAVWHKPPRFTMVPQLGDHDETLELDYE